MKSKIEIKLLLHDLKSLNSELTNKRKKLDYINLYVRDRISNNDIKIETDKINNSINDNKHYDNNEDNETLNENYTPIENLEITKKDIFLNENTKKIYREIVLITHPDKLEDNDKRNEYLNYYRDATDAKNKNNISLLLIIADELNINCEEYLNDENIINIKDNINIIKSQLLHIEQMNIWKWYHTENEKLKDILLKNFVKNFK